MSGASDPRALVLPLAEERALLPLRAAKGLRALEEGDRLWVRTDAPPSPELQSLLAGVPASRRYRLDPATQALTAPGARVPSARLPEGEWRPIADRFELAPRPATLPARPPSPVPLRLVPDEEIEGATPGALLCDPATLLRFADEAAHARLAVLALAVSAGHATSGGARALVRGRPLPPVAGSLFALSEGGVATPLGLRLEPRLDAASERSLFGLEAGDVALVRPAPEIAAASACKEHGCGDGSIAWERIPATAFVRGARASFRASLARWASPLEAPP